MLPFFLVSSSFMLFVTFGIQHNCYVNIQAEAAQSQNTAAISHNRATVPSVVKGQSQTVGGSWISKEVGINFLLIMIWYMIVEFYQ